MRALILRGIEVTLLRVRQVSFATPEAVKSSAKWRATSRNLRFEILDRL
jgi:tRNA threonylcarbamoyladenosine modification (KEOPS) complex Cgi121 subunit